MNSKGNLNRVTKFFMEKLKINANIERLFFFILTFLLLNHLCACFWYFMAKLEDFSPDSWVVRLGYIDSSNIELYIISFYWTLTTVTTVGYGDITAGTTIERVYNLFIMSFGVLLYSFAIGSLSSIVSTLDQKSEEMNKKLQILSSIKKEFNLDQNIYDKVRKVIKYDLSKNQKDKMIFLQELPNKLRIELSQIMHDKVIQNFYFFRDQPSDFFAYVAPLLKPVKFSQNDYLYKCQDMIDEMYFVAKGTVIFCLDKKYGEKEIREIKKNNNFGEIEMCLNEKLTFNIKIKSRNCELFVLKKNDFLRLSVNFKEFIENFLHKSLMKYLKFNEEKNKMIKEFDALMNITENSQDEEEGEETSEEEEDEEGEEEDDEGDNGSLQSIDEEGSGSSSGSNSRNENENEGNEKKNEMIDSKSDNDSKSDKDKNDRIINLNEMEKESN
jgi:CRP-like cAMP-binding protein